MSNSARGPASPLGVVFVSSPSGHRGPYLSLLASLFGLAPLCSAPTIPVMWRLLRARSLLLATYDDHAFRYALLALVRGALGRSTVGLFLRPHRCFDREHFKSRLKGRAFPVIRRIPGLTLITITPFSVEPRYAGVAHRGVHDPQYWDLHDDSGIRTPPSTPLSDEIQRRAAGRRILCLPGALVLVRGLGFLADILRLNPTLRDRVLIVAAGMVRDDARPESQAFVAGGGLLIDRRLDDAELESLYVVSDVIWSCYAPEYDQASGIFGRALQLGVPVIVRRGSLLHRFASGIRSPVLPLEFGDVSGGARLLTQDLPGRLSGAELERHARLIGAWRSDFVQVVERALEPA